MGCWVPPSFGKNGTEIDVEMGVIRTFDNPLMRAAKNHLQIL
jgi:hypothetical protein